MTGMEAVAQAKYDWFWYDKYDYKRSYYEQNYEEEERAYKAQQETAALFREGQGGW